MGKKKDFFWWAAIMLGLIPVCMYGLFFFSIYKLNQSGENRVPLKTIYIYSIGILKYLPLSNFIIDTPILNMKLGYHIYHRSENDYTMMMKNGGDALKLFRQVDQSISLSPEDFINSKLEILNILVRIPWSDALKIQAKVYVDHLSSLLLKNSLSIDDQSIAHENIAIFYARIGNTNEVNKHAAEAKLADMRQFEPTIVEALNFIRHARIELGRCFSDMPLHAKWEVIKNNNIEEVVTQKFLRDQYYHSWDVALVKTVLLVSKNDECKKMAFEYQILANPSS